MLPSVFICGFNNEKCSSSLHNWVNLFYTFLMEVITTHIQADFDAYASVVAAKLLHPKALVVFPGAKERLLLKFLKEQPPPFRQLKIKDVPWADITTLIITDTRRSERIEPLTQLLKKDDCLIYLYDHHAKGRGDVEATYDLFRNRGATTTLMVELLQEKEIPITSNHASIFVLGIYEDTGSLTYAGVTEQDFQAVTWLMKQGADLSWVNKYLRNELNPHQVGMLHEALENFEEFHIGGFSIGMAIAESEDYVDDLALVTHKLRTMEKAPIIFLLARVDGRVQVIARNRVSQFP